MLKPLRCPHCSQSVNKRLLRQHKLLKVFLQRKVFPCPHCQQEVICPEQADTLISIGFLIAAILAPLSHLSQWHFIDSRALFTLGVAMVIAGALTQKLNKV